MRGTCTRWSGLANAQARHCGTRVRTPGIVARACARHVHRHGAVDPSGHDSGKNRHQVTFVQGMARGQQVPGVEQTGKPGTGDTASV